MTETGNQRILIELLYGKGAHADPIASVQGIPAKLASRRLQGYPHSIFQILSHMNFWMEYELRRISLEDPPYPAHAAESWTSDSSPASDGEWKQAEARFVALIGQLSALAQSDPEFLNREVKATHAVHTQQSSSVLAVLWQTAVHNSYHIGQIVLLRRLLNSWPGQAGDTW
ncbi:MAG TPA: DinB family protein [Terriglobales bacterium]|nr:DinB family protein [Terriglobales bacterium]